MFASRMGELDVSGIRKLFEAAKEDAIHLGIGEPHVQPAPHIIEAYVEALRAGKNRYSPTAGLPALRTDLAALYSDRFGGATADNVAVTAGSTAALFGGLFALIGDGDEVLVPDPGFVLYRPHTQLCGGTPVPYPLPHENGFQVDVEALKEAVTDRTKALIVNTPSNPTGTTLDKEAVGALADLSNDHGIWLFADEAYDALVYGGEHHSLLGRAERIVYLNTFSKRYAMTGWRVGYAVAPAPMAKKLRIACYHMYAAPNTPAQHAALAALRGPQDHVEAMRGELATRRDHIVRLLSRLDRVDLVRPTGAFYAFPRVNVPMPTMEFAMRLLEAGVVTVPGSAFGEHGEGHIRISFATDMDRIEAGVQVLEKVLEGI